MAAWRLAGNPVEPRTAGTSGGRDERMRPVKSARDVTLETTMQSGELELHGRPGPEQRSGGMLGSDVQIGTLRVA